RERGVPAVVQMESAERGRRREQLLGVERHRITCGRRRPRDRVEAEPGYRLFPEGDPLELPWGLDRRCVQDNLGRNRAVNRFQHPPPGVGEVLDEAFFEAEPADLI